MLQITSKRSHQEVLAYLKENEIISEIKSRYLELPALVGVQLLNFARIFDHDGKSVQVIINAISFGDSEVIFVFIPNSIEIHSASPHCPPTSSESFNLSSDKTLTSD